MSRLRKTNSEQEREGGVHILTIREEEVCRLVLSVTTEKIYLNKIEKMVFTY